MKFLLIFIMRIKELRGGSPKNHPTKKIEFFRSTSHVDFLKAHIKISFLFNSRRSKKVCEAHMGSFSSNEIFH